MVAGTEVEIAGGIEHRPSRERAVRDRRGSYERRDPVRARRRATGGEG